ncbi:MAG: mercury methylation ferredoxin HgcB [Thermodesulfobacteriota bacterium]
MENIRYLSGVSTLKLDQDRCVGCGMCELVCPHGVLALQNNKAGVRDRDGCMECGACALNCPTSAIELSPGVGCAGYIIQTWLKGKSSYLGKAASCC